MFRSSFAGLSREVWWLSGITLINRAGTMVIPFLSLYLTDAKNFTLPQVGWVMTAFGLGSTCGSYFGGWLTDRIGNYKVMVTSLVLSGLCFIALQLFSDFYALCIGVFITVTAADLFRPASMVALRHYSKPENRTRSVTLIRLAINLGFAAGPALGGLIIFSAGYNALFWIDGLTCIAAALVLKLALHPKRAKPNHETAPPTLQSAYRDSTYAVFVLSMVIFGFVFLQLFSTIPLYYRDAHNLTEAQIGLMMALNGLLIFVIEMPLIKYLESRYTSKIMLIVWGCVLVALSYFVFNLNGWMGVLIISMLLATLGEMLVFPFSNAFAMDRSQRGKQGQYMALYMMAFSVAHIFGHNSGMQLINAFGYATTWYVMGGLQLVGIACLVWLMRRVKNEVTHSAHIP
jgi:predicted MFS family arabinose efflux permease